MGSVSERRCAPTSAIYCNAASTASALKVNRHTVRAPPGKGAQETIGERLSTRRAELDVLPELEQLTVRTAADELPAS